MLLQEHKQSWVEDFNNLRGVIHEALEGLQISIEHVGSTAVPGLAAKPIIDIDIALDPAVKFDEIKIRLEKIGYRYNGNQGITDREVFKRNSTIMPHKVLDKIGHHLYVCPAHSEELQKHLLFRNYLLANKKAREEYQSLKYELAKEAGDDRKLYAQLKETKATKIIHIIIEMASKNPAINNV